MSKNDLWNSVSRNVIQNALVKAFTKEAQPSIPEDAVREAVETPKTTLGEEAKTQAGRQLASDEAEPPYEVELSFSVNLMGNLIKSFLFQKNEFLAKNVIVDFCGDEHDNDISYQLRAKKHISGQNKWDKNMREAMRIEVRDFISEFIVELNELAIEGGSYVHEKYNFIFCDSKIQMHNLLKSYMTEHLCEEMNVENVGISLPKGFEEISSDYYREHYAYNFKRAVQNTIQNPTYAVDLFNCAPHTAYSSRESMVARSNMVMETISAEQLFNNEALKKIKAQIDVEQKIKSTSPSNSSSYHIH